MSSSGFCATPISSSDGISDLNLRKGTTNAEKLHKHHQQKEEEVICDELIESKLTELAEMRDEDLINWKCKACSTGPLQSNKTYFGVESLLAHANLGSWTKGEKERHHTLAKLLKDEIDAREIDDLMTRNAYVDSGNKHLDPKKEEVPQMEVISPVMYAPMNRICTKKLSISDCEKNFEVPVAFQTHLQTHWDPRRKIIQLFLTDSFGSDEITVLVRERDDGLFFSAPSWKSFLRKRKLHAGITLKFFTTHSKHHVYVDW